MANTNSLLGKAKKDQKYEFYTRIQDIEQELENYRDYFKDKIIFCNCDDPYESNFFKYFAMNFNYFGLKKLITTCYVSSPVMHTQMALFPDMEETFETPVNPKKKPYKVEITEVTDENGDGAIDLIDVEYLLKNSKNVCTILNGDGDFSSPECLELLDEADIVVTNPPFGLFRKFISTLVEHRKDFIIIGNTNALSYKEVFDLFMKDEIRTGYTNFNVGMYFMVPESYQYQKIIDGQKCVRVASSCWFTNLPVSKHNEMLILRKKYSPEKYPQYDNYDAVEVGEYKLIPKDYDGVMGLPITFLDKYNPAQFELLGMGSGRYEYDPCSHPTKKYTNAKQHNPNGTVVNGSKVNTGCEIIVDEPIPDKPYYTADNVDGIMIRKYDRIFIRRRKTHE
jgi:hypothetical protein